jgi:hypothetical protein
MGGLKNTREQIIADEYNAFRELSFAFGKISITAVVGNRIPSVKIENGHIVALSLVNLNLVRLPDCIRSFSQLNTLIIQGNRISDLPVWIGDFRMLHFLDVQNNELKNLPESMVHLNQLTHFRFEGNPWSSFFRSYILDENIKTFHVKMLHYTQFLSQIQRKIKENLPLDDFDRNYPQYAKYEATLRPWCRQTSTKTANEIELLLDEALRLSVASNKILL